MFYSIRQGEYPTLRFVSRKWDDEIDISTVELKNNISSQKKQIELLEKR
jgi:hypothetical protein